MRGAPLAPGSGMRRGHCSGKRTHVRSSSCEAVMNTMTPFLPSLKGNLEGPGERVLQSTHTELPSTGPGFLAGDTAGKGGVWWLRPPLPGIGHLFRLSHHAEHFLCMVLPATVTL